MSGSSPCCSEWGPGALPAYEETSSYKTTCQAPHNRGLVTVSRKYPQMAI